MPQPRPIRHARIPGAARPPSRLFEDHLGHERPGLQVAAALELEQIPLGADHRSGREPIEKLPMHDTSMVL